MLQNIGQLLSTQYEFFINLFLTHLRISAVAVIIAGILGLFIGITISKHEKLANVVLGIVNTFYTLPSIAILGILISFTGIGDKTAIIALIIYALLPMVRNTYVGIKNVDVNIVEAARAMGSTESEIMRKIKLPLAFPVLMSGVRNMVTMTIALGGIASYIGAGGLGVAIYRGITTNNSSLILLGSSLVALLALSSDFLIGLFEKHVRKTRKIGNVAKSVFVLIILLAFGTTLYPYFKPENDVIKIATKPNTEGYILGEMLSALIEYETGVPVVITHGIAGGTKNIHPAIMKGEFDLYPEYTGTSWNVVLKQEGLYLEDKFEEMNRMYKEELGLTWRGLYGFNNTYGVLVRREIAEKYNLKSYSDLAKVSEFLTFGANPDYFKRPDGYPKLESAYHFKFKKLLDIDTGLKYKALKQNEVDVLAVFTTDGQISTVDAVMLQDDLNFYPSYMAGTVVRTEVLKKHPKLGETLDKMNGILSEDIMIELNGRVEIEGLKPEEAAQNFLVEKGLLPADGHYVRPKKEPIKIATKPNTEGYILGEMLAALIKQETGTPVVITHGIAGGTKNIHPAIMKAEFDLYPEYTGTSWNVVLKQEGLYLEDKFEEMNKMYHEELGLTWKGLYGFNNTYGILVRREIAERYNLKTYSDLAKASEVLTFGANPDYYERPDGYPKLESTYNFKFKKLLDIDTGLKYKAMKQKEVDVLAVFTTDGQLSTVDAVMLEDDRHFYPSYNAGTVVRMEALKQNPQLEAALLKMNGILNEETMAKLNYSVEAEGLKPEEAAQKYLTELGLLEVK